MRVADIDALSSGLAEAAEPVALTVSAGSTAVTRGAQPGPRHPDEGPLGRAERGAVRVRHAACRAPTLPFDVPELGPRPLDRARLQRLYYWKHGCRVQATASSHPESFFYPLDSVRNWNRIYGKRASPSISACCRATRRRGAGAALPRAAHARGGELVPLR